VIDTQTKKVMNIWLIPQILTLNLPTDAHASPHGILTTMKCGDVGIATGKMP